MIFFIIKAFNMDLKKLHCFLKWAFPSSIHVWGWRCPQKLPGEELEHQEILGIQAGGTSSPFARLIEITSLWQNPFPSNFTSFFPWSPRIWGVQWIMSIPEIWEMGNSGRFCSCWACHSRFYFISCDFREILNQNVPYHG